MKQHTQPAPWVMLGIFAFLLFSFFPASFAAEKDMIAYIDKHQSEALFFLEKIVNINSSTDNVAGVYEVGKLVQKEFEALGFKSLWNTPPADMHRAGTLLLTRKGSRGKRLLLIAHLDTVFPKNSTFQTFKKEGNTVKGPGIIDDKAGIVSILYALKALNAQGLLEDTTITVALVGDEESSGKPAAISRAPLIAAAQGMDVALDFEPAAHMREATTSRRGISSWEIKSTGVSAHSSKIFHGDTGFGAIFELARVLNYGSMHLGDEPYATFNPGLIIGGTQAEINKAQSTAIGSGKDNVVAQIAMAKGDIRFLTLEEKAIIKKTLIDATLLPLPGTTSTISFVDGMPPMPPTENNNDLLALYNQVSVDLGYGEVTATDPKFRGAGDINYVASIVPANLGGLGPTGCCTHTIDETLDLESLNINTQRAAILIHRLTQAQ
ncbi:MAG: M20/M25/M40 family metallo-hydrolase [Legionellales bacterium]|jgi:glutamate carboxypeptidase